MRLRKGTDSFGGGALDTIVNNVAAAMAAVPLADTDLRATSARSGRRIAPAALPALKNAPRTSFAVRY